MSSKRVGLVIAYAALALAATQTASVTSVFLPGFDQQSLVASVITAAPSATTYVLQCGSENALDCGVGQGVTVTEGPSTFEINMNSTDMTISEACAISSDVASCTYTMAYGSSGAESASILPSMYLNVTITAGFEALASASSAAAAQAAAETAEFTAEAVSSTTSSPGVSATQAEMASASAVRTSWNTSRIAMVCGIVMGLLSW